MDKLGKYVKGLGVCSLGFSVYLTLLHFHYAEHPEAVHDGWIPLEWKEMYHVKRVYEEELQKLKMTENELKFD